MQCSLQKKRPNGDVWRCTRLCDDPNLKLCAYHRELNRIRVNRHAGTPKQKATRSKARKKPHRRVVENAEKHNFKSRMHTGMRDLMKGKARTTKYMPYSGFTSRKDFCEHIESTFVAGMTWESYGEWTIGHRIPQSKYTSSQTDLKRCWSKPNVFAQWHQENQHQRNLLPSNEVVQGLIAAGVAPESWD